MNCREYSTIVRDIRRTPIRVSTCQWLLTAAAVCLSLAGYGQAAFAQAQTPPNRLGPLASRTDKPPSREKLLGVESIQATHGDAAPTGYGIPAAHIEGLRGDYLPRQSLSQFRDVRFTPRSGQSKANGHTTATARAIYGSTGLAPGIRDVHVYASAHWLGEGYLNAWTQLPPKHDDRRLFSHSWIRPTGGLISQDILRRVDYLIDTHDVIMCVGLNNGRETAIPAVLGSAYNVIAVGVRNGDNSGGYTWFEGNGRCKPDIVSIGGKTSFSTPIVAGITARLMETADRMAASDPEHENAQRSEVIKAALLAGAQKRDGWQREAGKPLDEHLGAGFARFDHSYNILTAGPSDDEAIDPLGGWIFEEVSAGDQQRVREFEVSAPHRDFSVILTWHRRIGTAPNPNDTNNSNPEDSETGKSESTMILSGGKVLWNNTPRVANFDLDLIHLDAPSGPISVQESRSRVDNVEHIFLKQLKPGRYRLVVHRHDGIQEPWEFALAWRSHNPAHIEADDELDGEAESPGQ